MLQISLVALVVIAIITVQTQRLRNAVIYMGVLSLTSSFVYLLYNAPDVAIAEAVVGSTLATVLYLVALRKYRLFTIFICLPYGDPAIHQAPRRWNPAIAEAIETFCAKKELEPQFILTTENIEAIMAKRQYGLILDATNAEQPIRLIGHPENYQLEGLKSALMAAVPPHSLEFVPVHEHLDGWEAES